MNIRALIPEWGYTEADLRSKETRLRGVRSDSTLFPAEITMNLFVAADAHMVTTAVRDATVQVEAEERIRQINTELERRVADRTVALTRSNEALRQFAWAASHDLQEPLRTVVSYSQLLERSCSNLSEQSQLFLNTVISGALRMERLLSSLRDYVFASDAGSDQTEVVESGELL